MKLQKYKHSSDYSYALGATLVAELFKAQPNTIKRVFLRPVEKHGANLDQILHDLRAKNIEIIESTKAFNILGAKDNCLLAVEFEKTSRELQKDAPHIVLVNPSDSGNLGTIIRTAAAFGYNDLAIITPAVDQFDPKVIRASMGAIFHLNIKTFENISEYQASYPDKTLYAFMLDKNAKTLTSAKPQNDNYALIFGNEAAGLPKGFTTKTGATPIFIPQSNQVDSLNLSIAAGVAMHYFSSVLSDSAS